MSFFNSKIIAGAALSLIASLVASHAGLADPAGPASAPVISQVNGSPEERVPPVPTETVRGRITRLGGDRVTIETTDGDSRTYFLPPENENREGLEVGNEVILSIKLGTILAFYTPAPPAAERTIIRRERTVQPRPTPPPAPRPAPAPAPRPAPAPTPAPAPAPAPQPIRGMW